MTAASTDIAGTRTPTSDARLEPSTPAARHESGELDARPGGAPIRERMLQVVTRLTPDSPSLRYSCLLGNCSPGGSSCYWVPVLRQTTAFPCRAMAVATRGL